MSDTQETHAAVIAEMRGYSYGMPDSYHVAMSWHDFRVVLARLEAAHKREVAQLRAKLGALIDACNIFHQSLELELDGHYDKIPQYLEASHDFLRDVAEAQAALAATETKGEQQ